MGHHKFGDGGLFYFCCSLAQVSVVLRYLILNISITDGVKNILSYIRTVSIFNTSFS